MPGAFRAAVIRAIPWLLFGSVLLPAFGSAVAGILVLVFWRGAGDIALGVLVIVMGLAVIAGTFTSLGLLLRQNRMARAQAEFIAHVSHELRTPMASIRMGIETLRDNRFRSEDERREFVLMLDSESRRLSGLVEQAIGLQSSSGRRASEDTPKPTGCASTMTRQALAGFLARTDTRDSIVFRDSHDASEPCNDAIAVDRDEFAGAICNLVGNALTHGRADASRPVEIIVQSVLERGTLHEVLAPFGEVIIEVRDKGPGLDPKEIEKIFEKFHRGRSTSDGAVPGLGLGLSIVRAFASSSGGLVTARNADDGGACFLLILPRRQDTSHE